MERSSFKRVDDLGHVELSAEQRPLLGWAIAMHLSVFVVMPLGLSLGLSVIAIPWFFLAVIAFIVGLTWRRRARFQITPTALRVDAWAGRMGRPTRQTLPLESLAVSSAGGARVNGRRVYSLTLNPADGDPLDIRGLACTRKELEQFEASLAAASERARARHGAGEAEIPAALRQLRQPE